VVINAGKAIFMGFSVNNEAEAGRDNAEGREKNLYTRPVHLFIGDVKNLWTSL
jgi:hypothetical protein